MSDAADYFVKKAVQIEQGEQIHFLGIENFNSHQRDRTSAELEREFELALNILNPDFTLTQGKEELKKDDVSIKGTYNPQGDKTSVRLIVQRNTTILSQYEFTFDSEGGRSRTLVAVLDLESSILNPEQAKAFSEIFRGSLSETNVLEIASSAEVDKLDPDAIQKTSGCTRDECATIIGEQLGVDRVVATSLLKVSDLLYVLSGKIIDIKDGEVIKTRTVKHKGGLEDLDKAIGTLALKLTSDEKIDVVLEKTAVPPIQLQEGPGRSAPDLSDKLEKKVERKAEKAIDKDPKEQKENNISKDNRKKRWFFVGAVPAGYNHYSELARPLTLGIYLGSNAMLGLELGTKKSVSSSEYNQSGEFENSQFFLRIFSGETFNYLLGLNTRTWTGTASDSDSSLKVEEMYRYVSFGIGSQWLLDSGVTIGADWFVFAPQISEKSSESGSGSDSDKKELRSKLSSLKEDLGDNAFDPEIRLISLTIGWSF